MASWRERGGGGRPTQASRRLSLAARGTDHRYDHRPASSLTLRPLAYSLVHSQCPKNYPKMCQQALLLPAWWSLPA